MVTLVNIHGIVGRRSTQGNC